MNSPDDYINRKKFYSIQVQVKQCFQKFNMRNNFMINIFTPSFLLHYLQVICDENVVFLDVLAGWPGSVHDSRVLRNSDIFNQAMNRFPGNAHLLGDSGYPLLP